MATFNPQEADLVVLLPWYIIRWPNMNVIIGNFLTTSLNLRTNRFGLGDLFASQPFTLQHVKKVGITPSIQLVGTLNTHSTVEKQVDQGPMRNRCSDLGFYIVTDDRQAGLLELSCPYRIRSYKDWYAVNKTT